MYTLYHYVQKEKENDDVDMNGSDWGYWCFFCGDDSGINVVWKRYFVMSKFGYEVRWTY